MGETVPAATIIGLVTNPRGDLILSPVYPSAEISCNRSSKGGIRGRSWPELAGLFDHAFGLMPFLLRVLPPVEASGVLGQIAGVAMSHQLIFR